MAQVGRAMPTTVEIPTPNIRRRIAAIAQMPDRTVLKVYRRPRDVRATTLDRVAAAALQIGVVPPKREPLP